MKKLMIAAAIVCAAAVTQAANWKWTTSNNAYSVAADTIAAGLTDGQSYDAETTLMKNAGLTFTYVLTLTDTTVGGSENYNGSVGYSLNKISKAIGSYDETGDFVVRGHVYNYTIAITSSEGTDGEGNAYTLSTTLSGTWEAQTMGTVSLSTAAPTSWTASVTPAPEPTSAMLLLLGMAGLALKRRRA